jgi:hypothetical protein
MFHAIPDARDLVTALDDNRIGIFHRRSKEVTLLATAVKAVGQSSPTREMEVWAKSVASIVTETTNITLNI